MEPFTTVEFTDFITEYQKIVEKYPNHIGIIEGNSEYTHQELWNWAIQIANLNHERSLVAGNHIGLYMPKSAHLIAAILGCWMTGLVWVPLDPELPLERLNFYVEDAKLDAIFFHHHPFSHRGETPILQLCLPKYEANWSKPKSLLPITASTPAYLLYSSGSTGVPKGVLLSHSGIVSVIRQQIDLLDLTTEDRCLWWLSMQFDASISDIAVALLSASSLVIVPTSEILDHDFLHILKQYQITYVDLPPVYLVTYHPQQFPQSLRKMLIGGEICPSENLYQHAQYRKVVLVYGPTEATVCTSMTCYTRETTKVFPVTDPIWQNAIGQPLMGVDYRIVDQELWIGGPHLALGYWNRPDLDGKWVKDDQRYFRTGDLVTLEQELHSLPRYHFRGRIDRQLKLHGKLIAPEEIEEKLIQFTPATRALVIKHHNLLYAFLEGDSSHDYAHFIPKLQKILPDWMVPKQGQFLSTFPTTPSGKVDLTTLHGQIKEEMLIVTDSNIWVSGFSTVLGIVCRENDDFFAIGGDSIATLLLISWAEQQGCSLTPELLQRYRSPTALQHYFTQQMTSSNGISTDVLAEYVENELQQHPPISRHSIHSISTNSHAKSPILLTGVTGFLGHQIALALLQKNLDLRVLVRAKDSTEAYHRLPIDIRDQVDTVVGDLNHEEDIRDFVQPQSTKLIHCAAQITLGQSLEEMYNSNVRPLSIFASIPHLTTYHISTLAIFLASDSLGRTLFEHEQASKIPSQIFGGYAQSKWIADQIAQAHQMPVIRLGLLVDAELPQRNDVFVLFLKGLIKVGYLPLHLLKHVYLDMTDLTYAVQSIVHIMENRHGGTYHLSSGKFVYLSEIIDILSNLGIQIQSCNEDFFQQMLQKYKQDLDVQVFQLGLHFSLTKSYIHKQYDMFLATNFEFDDRCAAEVVQGPCPIPNKKFIKRILKAIINL